MKNIPVNYELVKLNDLNMAHYQRPVNLTWCKKKALEFNKVLLGTILVSRRNGKLYVLDGQHRVTLCKMIGLRELMACVYEGLTYEEEAKIFSKINGEIIKLKTADIFNAAVEAKDEDALAIKETVENVDFRIGKASGTNTITAVRELQNIYNKHSNSHLYNTLLLIKRTWGGERESLSAKTIKGVSEFTKVYEKEYEFSKEIFIKQLSKVTAKQILAESRTDLSTNSVNVRVMNVLLKYYNARLRNNKLENKHFIA